MGDEGERKHSGPQEPEAMVVFLWKGLGLSVEALFKQTGLVYRSSILGLKAPKLWC